MYGEDGWVEYCENGIFYCFDVIKCMFLFGNVFEKFWMVFMKCVGEIVVDFFVGIGYYILFFFFKYVIIL